MSVPLDLLSLSLAVGIVSVHIGVARGPRIGSAVEWVCGVINI